MERSIFVFMVSLLSIICLLFGTFLYAWLNNYKLFRYLKKNKYETWRELSTIGKFGPGLANPFKGFRYIYGEQDNEDERILRYKDAIRIGFRYSLVSFGAIVVNIAIIIILAKRMVG